MGKLTEEEEIRIVALREAGMSWTKLSDESGYARSTCQMVVKRMSGKPAPPDLSPKPVEARVLKPFPNPRLIQIYFGERKNPELAKCVVRPGYTYRANAVVKVIECEYEPGLYRLV
tara:strand:- start:215 stop:562 length:348 start_codon:yes stop_codon:yes gene_type:complete